MTQGLPLFKTKKKKSSQTAFIQYFGNSLYKVYHEKLGYWENIYN